MGINGMARGTRKSITGSRVSANRKISEAMKQKWQDKEYRAAMTQKIRNSASDRTKKQSTTRTRRTRSSNTWESRKKLNTSSQQSVRNNNTESIQMIQKQPIEQQQQPIHEVIIPATTAKSLGIDIQEDQMRITQLRQERRDLYDLLYDDDYEDLDDDDDAFDDFLNADGDQQVQLKDFWAVAK